MNISQNETFILNNYMQQHLISKGLLYFFIRFFSSSAQRDVLGQGRRSGQPEWLADLPNGRQVQPEDAPQTSQ